MANTNGTSEGLEWRVTISDRSPEKPAVESSWICRAWIGLLGIILALKSKVWRFWEKIRKLAVDDPRRIFHCFKVGLALTLVSLFYYIKPLHDGIGGTAMWAICTVVVVFEYTVGATLSKGLNRGVATLVAGALGFAIHWLASQTGEKAEPVVLGVLVFLIVSTATFFRFVPTVKTRFDYGVLIFILTFSLVSISGYHEEKLFKLARERLCTIAIGGFMCLLVSISICPIWAGEELHHLITCNIEKLANSLDDFFFFFLDLGYVAEYFNESGSTSDNKEPCQKSQGYKSVLNSKTTEESLANLARWEPPHGRCWFRHPWKQYLKIAAAIRCCAYRVEALNGSINSEIKAPEFMKKHLSEACIKLSFQSSMVLKELVTTTKSMSRSSNIEFLVGEMNGAVEDLRSSLKSLPDQVPPTLLPPSIEAMEEETPCISTTKVPLTEVMPLVVLTSLLIEIAGRIQGVVDAVNELAAHANFKPAVDAEPR
ncbi:aluminum-activated malate transporter 10-like [Magnolia sinica]|uniref:aluminum-activated malate transporter 10-like n=1 Tax=Magnolia sinica TaxID=86752 RepID=UPI002658595A|nr:aluminum-activated malate transporter 10-like [Magnolia sinica]